MTEQILTQARLRELLHYNPETGEFTWLLRIAQCIKVGDKAGSIDNKGYLKIGINKKVYAAHRLAWIYFYGEIKGSVEIDHINRNKSDNRITNLRMVSHKQNMENQETHFNNKSGYKGVSWWAPTQKWKAQIGHYGKKYHIGLYQTKKEAKVAYEERARQFHTHYPKDVI